MISSEIDGETFRLGVQVPIVSRFFVNRAISAREKAIARIRDRFHAAVAAERTKIEKVIESAKRTNIHSLVVRASALPGKLEDAACVKVKFEDIDEFDEITKPGMSKEEEIKIKAECAEKANAETGQSWKDARGHFSTTDPTKLEIARKWQEIYERCKKERGLS